MTDSTYNHFVYTQVEWQYDHGFIRVDISNDCAVSPCTGDTANDLSTGRPHRATQTKVVERGGEKSVWCFCYLFFWLRVLLLCFVLLLLQMFV